MLRGTPAVQPSTDTIYAKLDCPPGLPPLALGRWPGEVRCDDGRSALLVRHRHPQGVADQTSPSKTAARSAFEAPRDGPCCSVSSFCLLWREAASVATVTTRAALSCVQARMTTSCRSSLRCVGPEKLASFVCSADVRVQTRDCIAARTIKRARSSSPSTRRPPPRRDELTERGRPSRRDLKPSARRTRSSHRGSGAKRDRRHAAPPGQAGETSEGR